VVARRPHSHTAERPEVHSYWFIVIEGA
jgi:hypothetical protein